MPDDTTANGSAQGAPPAQDLMAELERERANYAASSSEAKRLKQERDFFEQQLQQRQPQQPSNDPFQRLRDEGWPVDSLLPAMRTMAREELMQELRPVVGALNARGEVLSEYPDYASNEAAVMKFVNETPAVQQRYTSLLKADPAAAMDWAYLKYGASKPKEPANGSDKGKRSDAQIPSGRGAAPGRSGNEANPMVEVAENAIKAYQKAGDQQERRRAAETYGQARLRSVIPDSFFER